MNFNTSSYLKGESKRNFDIEMFFSPKVQRRKIAFINQIEPSIISYEYFMFEKYSDETRTELMIFWIIGRILRHDITGN